MKTRNFEDVSEFLEKFDMTLDVIGMGFIPLDLEKVRMNHLKEEVKELEEAYETMNLEGVADALVDIVYIAMGTARMHNFPWQDMWDEIHAANLRKIRVIKSEDSKRGTTFDVAKPDNWAAPNLRKVFDKQKL